MSKTLLILRHAKSSWGNDRLPDHDRPLNERGKRDAVRVGQLLKETGRGPDVILCSSAKRARKTAKRVAEHGQFEIPLQVEDAFYLAEPPIYLHRLAQLPDDVQRALVVGHNPGLQHLVQQLTGHKLSLPTAALVELRLECQQWHHIGQSRAELIDLWTPEDEQPAL